METLSAQIASAIGIALSTVSTPESRHLAHTFLSQVKDANLETWQTCLSLFLELDSTGAKKWGAQERMFGVQVVGESLPNLSPEAISFVQSSLFDYFAREYVTGVAEQGVTFLKNASIHLVTILFSIVYPTSTPEFFTTFISLLHQYPSAQSTSSPLPFNPKTTDLFLRILHEISTEISDSTLRLNKTSQRSTRDGLLRDALRLRDAEKISVLLWQILEESLNGLGQVENGIGLKGKDVRETTEMAVRVIGDYVSWIDINLMVTPTTIPLLLRALHLPEKEHIGIRIAAADAILETVTKGMLPNDKLSLLAVLDLGVILDSLKDVGRVGSERDAELDNLREKLAKVLNGVGLELCKISEEATATEESKSTAMTLVNSLLPLLLRFLSDENDVICSTVFLFAGAMLTVYKKEKKRALGLNAIGAGMTAEKRTFLVQLLQVSLGKMEYSADVEWEMGIEGEEDEDQVAFTELRKSLKIIVEGVAWIDPELYSQATHSLVIATLDLYEVGGISASSLSWQRIELAIYLIYGFGAAISGTGPGAFVQCPAEEYARAKREPEYRIDYTQFPLSVIGEMMLKACRSKVVEYSHPAASLQFFEVIVRYHEFFKLCPEYIPQILPSFLDGHGLHQEDAAVQARVFYLFSRFIYSAKAIIQSQVSGELISTILSRMQDLLIVTTSVESEILSDEALTKTAAIPTPFDAQLYLFETVGTLISILNQIPSLQVSLTKSALTPLLVGLQANVRTNPTTAEDFTAILHAHHFILAIGNLAKGFPDLSGKSPIAIGDWVGVFKEGTEVVLGVAKSMGSFVIIRDAARFAFNRIVATTGEVVLPLIPTLIDCLINQVTFDELADLLNFLSLLVAKYKTSFEEILDTLLMPVFNRIFHFLKLPITGTDDTVLHSQLRRAYFSLILAIAGANLSQVFYSAKNQPHLEDILKSVVHYISNDSLAIDQKFGFLVLEKLLAMWVVPVTPVVKAGVVPMTESPVPGFEQYLYNSVVAICFEIPLKKSFDFEDAQSYQVIGEIANFLKALQSKRGVEFSNFMRNDFLPSIQCPTEAGEQFMTALTGATDGKAFKRFCSDWLRSSRGPV